MPSQPVTLGDLIRQDKLLWVYCCDCYHERDVNPATVPLPAETPVPEVGKHMKCSACGSRKIDARPGLYPGGVEAMRRRLRGCPRDLERQRRPEHQTEGKLGLLEVLL